MRRRRTSVEVGMARLSAFRGARCERHVEVSVKRSELRPKKTLWNRFRKEKVTNEPSRLSVEGTSSSAPPPLEENDLDYWQSQGKKIGEVASALGAGWQLQISSLSMGTGTVIAICAVAVASVSGTMVALTAALRPALKAMEESCEALQIAAESVERAALALEQDLPKTLADVDAAAVEFTQLGQDLRTIAGGLAGIWAQDKRKGKRKQDDSSGSLLPSERDKSPTTQWPWMSNPSQTGGTDGRKLDSAQGQDVSVASSVQGTPNSTLLDLWDEDAGIKSSIIESVVGDFRRRISAAMARRKRKDGEMDQRRLQVRAWIARWRRSTVDKNVQSLPTDSGNVLNSYHDDIDEYVEEYERRIRQDAALLAVGEAIAAAEEVARDAMARGENTGIMKAEDE